ncbi:MAG TPA: GNAT family protein [Nocardioides sp.]|uniref:GNAT family N-acetyltransferase n=1 Tax=Nocardioides sp. TaxID=35761 RepID=UPI002E2FCD92|nr:GNAT family protein [Nocardioides sp.]HEX3932064.1 GNAT family protein [Nocardioides sp.]
MGGDAAQDLTAFDRVSWPVRSERLAIRPPTPEDFSRLYEIRAAPGVTQWLTGAPASLEDYVERYGTPERLATTLVLEAEGAVVGDLFCAVESPWSQAEVRDRARNTLAAIGWCLDPAYTGRGYATEAAAALLRICFEDIAVRRVVAGAFADNAASVRVMEKIGMRIEGRGVRDSLHRDLGWLDGVTAAILLEEWRERHR